MNSPHNNTLTPIPQEPQPVTTSQLGALAAVVGVLVAILQLLLQAAEATFWATFWASLVPLLVTLWALMPLLLIAGGLGWCAVHRRRVIRHAQAAEAAAANSRLCDHTTRLAALEALAFKRRAVAARRKIK